MLSYFDAQALLNTAYIADNIHYENMKMKLTSLQQHRLSKWWLLEELRTLFLSADSEMVVQYTLKEPTSTDMPSKDLQRSLLEQLASTGHILLKPLDAEMYEATWQFEFETLHRKQQELVKNIGWQSGEHVAFDDDTTTLSLGTKTVKLPPYKLEHLMCQVMFKYRLNEPVDSSVVYEEMQETLGGDGSWNDAAKRQIKDGVRRINKRVDEGLDIPQLFKLEQNTVKRTF